MWRPASCPKALRRGRLRRLYRQHRPQLTEGYAKFFSGCSRGILLENFKQSCRLFLKKGIARMK
jgi:hypothetical protein